MNCGEFERWGKGMLLLDFGELQRWGNPIRTYTSNLCKDPELTPHLLVLLLVDLSGSQVQEAYRSVELRSRESGRLGRAAVC